MADQKPLLVVPGRNIHLRPQEQEATPVMQPVNVICPSCGNVNKVVPKKSRFTIRCRGERGCGSKLRVDISDTISGPGGGSAVTVTILKGKPHGLPTVGDGI